jgi:molybdopterin-guanine dinucleotide biosynthesis protein A
MKYDMPAVLFAGGKSSRMGRDKTLLPFSGYRSLSEFQYARLGKLFQTVYISAKNNKFDFQAHLIEDLYEVASPLVGIISVFESLDAEEVFILSADAPFVDKTVIYTLIKNRGDHDAVIARTKSGKQPLCGIYRRSVLSAAQENFKADDHRIGNLLNRVNTKFIFFEDDAAFSNLNHPHEYEEAVKRIAEGED